MTNKANHLIEERHGHLVVLTMNRPEALNAFSTEITSGLQEAIPRLADDPDCRVLMLTGAGRAFSAGGDVKGFAGNRSSDAQDSESQPVDLETLKRSRVTGLRLSTEIVEHLHHMPKPTIAAIPGVAAGGGLSVALACDLRVASTDARLTTAFNKLGLSGDYGGTYFLTQLVGPAKARELYFTSEIVDASEALRIGLVNQLFEAKTFVDDALEFAQRIAAMPPISTKRMKHNLNHALIENLSSTLDLEAENITECFFTEDHKRGARAFVTKEEPVFTGS